MSPSALSL